ncbi:hypothetical protein [Streptomyces sp. NPDC005989]|uniref:hypothetical protein n=1 Tax=Streptomyces sp. NPDC005989 TaxID=3156727 RepID=UPI0033E89209
MLDDHPDGYIDWFTGSWGVMPLRQMPPPDHARVKAYRKQAREGILPPALLWWFSGLAPSMTDSSVSRSVREALTPGSGAVC